ncbi:DNA cytosine methyltransferase [Candidatus Pelagibacter sp. Uisw_104]|uniref:DNA cytosine methyltransferase n=1 Tax=Candidatus Pelagibacter sp. Uisw_104 TaxID=3230983 RepID=UPI0039EB78B3
MSKNFIHLFCGAGGLSLGFERAGFKCVGAINISKASLTYSETEIFLIVYLLIQIFQKLILENLVKKLEIKK